MSSPSKNLKRCVVPYCMYVGTKGFASFPSDLHEKHVWRKLCGLPYVKPRALVCHSHFKDSCFVDDNRERRKLLKNSRNAQNYSKYIQMTKHYLVGSKLLRSEQDGSNRLVELLKIIQNGSRCLKFTQITSTTLIAT